MWDHRYSSPDYIYGTLPNDFLAAHAHKFPPGPVLDLGCGEGRNAVFLAQLGHPVTGLDQSAVGLAKASRLAAERGVPLTTLQADLATYTLPTNHFAAITSIFCHLPSSIRRPLYAAIPHSLLPGGLFLLEAYTPAQLTRGTGGPPDPDMLLSLEKIKDELQGLDVLLAHELERDVLEGTHHTGLASVLQFIARRPA